MRYTEKFPTDDKLLGYLTGFIAADGCLVKQKNGIEIGLAIKDKNHLQWISSQLIYENYILKLSKQNMLVRFRVALPRLYQYCLDMGITPAKSLTLDVNLDGKSEEFIWYFLRGVIDGDGCIYYSSILACCSIRICSASLKFVETLQKYFGGTISFKQKSCKILQFKGRQAKQLAQKLPREKFTLQRKTERIEKILLLPGEAFRRSSVLTGKLWNLYKKPLNMYEAWKKSKQIVSYPTVKWRIREKDWNLEKALTTPIR